MYLYCIYINWMWISHFTHHNFNRNSIWLRVIVSEFFSLSLWCYVIVVFVATFCSCVICICRVILYCQSMQLAKLLYIMHVNMATKILSNTWYRMLQTQSSIWLIIRRKYKWLAVSIWHMGIDCVYFNFDVLYTQTTYSYKAHTPAKYIFMLIKFRYIYIFFSSIYTHTIGMML